MDPVLTPIFLSVLTAAGLPTVIGSISVASVLSSLTLGVISVAVMSLLAPKPKKPEDGKFAVQQATPPRIFAYGRCRIAGYTVLLEEYAGWLYFSAALCAHKCHAVTGYYLNDDVVTLDGSGYVNAQLDGRYRGNTVHIETRLGEATETPYSSLSPLYAPGYWNASNTGDGVASLALVSYSPSSKDFPTAFPYGRPMPSLELETAILYDPRTDVWEYSDNTALEILHFLCFSEFGPQREYNEAILPVVDVWKAAADICDELVNLRAGGNEKRYRSGGFDTTEHDTRTVLNELLSSCDGWLCELGDGTIILTVGKFEEPTHTITDDDIVGWTIQSDVPDEYAVNEVATTFCFVDAGYSTTSVDPWEDLEDQAARGGKRSARMELTFVQSFSQARRLAKRELIRQKERVRGQLVMNIGALAKVHKRFLSVDSSIVPFLGNRIIENRKVVVSIQTGTITMDYIGSGPYIDEWTPETDEGMPPSKPFTSVSVTIPPPSNVSATVEEVAGDAYVDISFDEVIYSGTTVSVLTDSITYVVRWRYETVGTWVEVAYSTPPAAVSGRVTLTLSPVPQGTSIDVAVCNVGTGGTRTEFSDPITVSTVVASAAPGSPTDGTATGSVGSATVTWYNPNSETFKYAEVFRGGVTDPFSSTSLVSPKIYGSPNQYMEYTDTVAPGSYGYWVVAYSDTGSASTPSGPFTATVT